MKSGIKIPEYNFPVFIFPEIPVLTIHAETYVHKY